MTKIKNTSWGLFGALLGTVFVALGARDGSGNYTLPAGNPVVSGTAISTTWANNTLGDIRDALTASVAKDGQTALTGNLSFGGFRANNLSAGTAGNPSWNFTSDTDTGMYRVGANDLGLAIGGALHTEFLSNRVELFGTAPGFFLFENDQSANMGLWRITASGAHLFIQSRHDDNTAGATVLDATLAAADTLTNVELGGTQWEFPAGSAAAASIIFDNDVDTGFYHSAANTMDLSIQGAKSVEWNNDNQQLMQNATAALPTYSFVQDPDTGFYKAAADEIGMSFAGTAAGALGSGTYTGTVTGLTTSPTYTIHYTKLGTTVHLSLRGAWGATSNTTALTITGAPATIRPAASTGMMPLAEMLNNSVYSALGGVVMNSGGTLVFYLSGSTTGWTNTGSKGGAVGFEVTYNAE